MKRKGIQLNRILGTANQIQNQVAELEKTIRDLDMKISEIRENTSRLTHENSDLNPYVREKIKRLDSLLLEEQNQIQKDSIRRLEAMHRQLNRILDSDLSDLYGTAIQKRIDRYASLSVEKEKRGFEVPSFHMFRIGETIFALRGTQLLNTESLELKEYKLHDFPRNDALDFFNPLSGQSRQEILIQSDEKNIYRLKIDEYLKKDESDQILKNLRPLTRIHPFIEGKIRIRGGQEVMILKPDPERSGF